MKEACQLKGVNYKTIQNKSYLKPPQEFAKKIDGRVMWEIDIINEWIKKDDKTLLDEWKRKKLWGKD